MNIEEIKERLSNLEAGKVVKFDHAMNLATQYMIEYKNDVGYLLQQLEIAQNALESSRKYFELMYENLGNNVEHNVTYLEIINTLAILKE